MCCVIYTTQSIITIIPCHAVSCLMLAKFACGPWHRYTVQAPLASLDLIFIHFSSKYISSVSMGANLPPALPPLPPLVKKLDKNK